jgi:hypothetical protein
MALGNPRHLARMLRQAGDAVVFGATSSFGILNVGDEVAQMPDGGLAQVRTTTLLVASDDFDGLSTGETITVADADYRIDRIAPEDDGEVTKLYLARIP